MFGLGMLRALEVLSLLKASRPLVNMEAPARAVARSRERTKRTPRRGTCGEVAGDDADDEKWGEQVAAFIRPAAGAASSAEELFAFCREHLAPHKTPRHWELMDSFPLTPSGKVPGRSCCATVSSPQEAPLDSWSTDSRTGEWRATTSTPQDRLTGISDVRSLSAELERLRAFERLRRSGIEQRSHPPVRRSTVCVSGWRGRRPRRAKSRRGR
jgi:hypothetical protein